VVGETGAKKRKRRRRKKASGESAQAQGQPGEGADNVADATSATPATPGGTQGGRKKSDRRERKPRFDRERPAFAAGDVVFGKVIEITDEAIFVDLSGKGTGIFDRQEMLLSDDAASDSPGDQAVPEPRDASNEAVAVANEAPAEAPAEEAAPLEEAAAAAAAVPPAPTPAPFAPPIVLEEGAHFVAIVHNDGSRGGLIVLTRHPRRLHTAKAAAEKAAKEGTRVLGLVTGVIKGGVEVDVAGLRAFCPASHMSLRMGADLTGFVGQRLEFDVAQYSAKGHNVVLSRRAQLEAEATEHRAVALARIRPLVGQAVEGIVRSVVPFGAFVDLGDVEGLVPLAEMSHNRSDGPADVFKVGEVVQVQVQKVDDKGKIWLSRKALVDDPWASVAEKYKAGTHHTGKVVRIQPFGVFVELEPGVDGLIRAIDLMFNDRPISLTRFEHPSEVVKVGDEFAVVVSHLEPGAHRISLHPALQGEAANEAPQRVQVYKSAKAVIHTIDLAMLHIRLLGVTGCNARGVVLGSGTGTERGTDLKKKFKVGEVVEGKIMEIEPRRCEVKLSLRALSDDQERNAFKVYRDQVKRDSKFTFGDLLAKKGGLTK
jgi:small subunit ribosomal protein S1